jgi:hypothetical protein
MTFAKDEYARVTAQMRAIKGAWHGNVVRIQIAQDEYLDGGDGWSAHVFRDKVTAAIAYAESLGLAVVINDTTEATGGINAGNEPGPTARTLAFWRAMERYRNDLNVILDLFNEPRRPSSRVGDWNLLFHGDKTYIGEDALIRDIRNMGFSNQLWVEGTGSLALTELVATWPRYRLTDPDHNFVYEYHHPTVDEASVPSPSQWDTQFGLLVTEYNQPVVDGEWTNRSIVPGTGTPIKPSGDVGQCWGNAPVSVPEYLSYLQARDIGMTVWALGPGPQYRQYDMINADGDNGPYITANNYDHWVGCVTPKNGHTSGAGQLLMQWFTQQNR